MFAQYIGHPTNRDEAAIGYNALLLSETGKDEWQQSWPLALESFGDYKLPGYPFVVAGLFTIFPTNEIVLRLPAMVSYVVILGIGWLYAQKLLSSHYAQKYVVAALAASPVFFFYQQFAYEALMGLALFLVGLYILLFKLDAGLHWGLIGMSALMCSFLTYNSPFLLLPFMLILIIFHHGVADRKTWQWPVLLLSMCWLLLLFFWQGLIAQKGNITVFSDSQTILDYGAYRQSFDGIAQVVLGNKYVYFALQIAENMLHGLRPSFVVQGIGGHPWHTLKGYGHVFAPQYVLFIVGVLAALYVSIQKAAKKQILFPLLLGASMLPAAITTDAPHATRSLFMFFLMIMFGGVGYELFEKMIAQKRLLFSIFVLVLTLSWVQFAGELSSNLKAETQKEFRSGLTAVLIEHNLIRTQPVAVVDPDGYHYIHLAWELKLNPNDFWSSVVKQQPNAYGFRYGERLMNIHFIAEPQDRSADEALVYWDETFDHWRVEK